MSERIPVAAPDLSELEERYVLDAVRSTWIGSTGKYVERFEREFARFCDAKAAIPVANGTVALHLALVGLGLAAGDEVIVPALTYVATANAARYCGAEPVFADVDPQTWCLDPGRLEEQVTPRTRGIIAVDLYGHPPDMDAIQTVADRHGLWVLADSAQAHGARYKGRPTGGIARVASFSFFGNKILTCGEGGALTVQDEELATTLRTLRNQGVAPGRKYQHDVVGYNYRATNVACAILCAQLERYHEIVAQRRRIFECYRALLDGIPGIGFQPVASWAQPAPWLFCITVGPEFGRSSEELASTLAADGIETRPFFIPMHRLPMFADRDDGAIRFPVAEELAARGLNLPTFSALGSVEIERVCASVRRGRG